MATPNILLLQLRFSLFPVHHIEMVWLLFFLIKLCSLTLLEVQSHSLKFLLLQVQFLTCYVLFLVLPLCHSPYQFHFQSQQNSSPSLRDDVYFFALHCPCRLTMCQIEACRFHWELFQIVFSSYSGNNGPCRLYSVIEALWVGWLLVSWVSFWCLRLRLAKVLTLRRM